MSVEANIGIAKRWMEGFTSGRDPDEIAASFADDLDFEIQGDDGALPWLGKKTGRSAMADFARDYSKFAKPVTLEVEDVLANENRAVIVASGQTLMKATGKIVATKLAIVLTIRDDVVIRFQMFEDSFGVSKAAR